MNKTVTAIAAGFVASLCLPLEAPAQTPPAYRLICQAFGASTREELVDRQGHAVTTGGTSCRVEGGPVNGGVTTIAGVSEADGDVSTVLVTHAMTRKPGSMVLTVGEAGKSTLVKNAEGEVTGTANTHAANLGEVRACFGVTENPAVFNFYLETGLSGLAISGKGECTVALAHQPEKNMFVSRCT